MANKSTIYKAFDPKEFLTPLQNDLIELLQKGPLTRRELVKKTETPRTTIYDNLIKLQARKVVESFSRNNGARGRPLIFWKI
jgi:sugar-specific transcriptional regulator TrmB